jgi:hypothetical protein
MTLGSRSDRGWHLARYAEAIVALIIAFSLTAPARPPSTHHSGRVLLMGGYIIIFDDMRVLFNAGMTAGNFFDELERRKTRAGEQFFIGSRPISFYPDSVRVDLFGGVWKSGETPLDKRYPGTAAALMDSLQIRAEWKTGLSTRPVSKLSVRRLKQDETAPIILWRYQLDISDERVPLTDHLIVNVYGPDNGFVARFSAAP